MKNLMVVVLFVLAASAGAVTVHRSFRNGYPAGAQGVKVRRQPNSAALKAPKMPRAGRRSSPIVSCLRKSRQRNS